MWFCTMSRSAPARVVVSAAPALHAERLGDGDLHVVDVLLVEERLEDRVAEAERQNVLDRFLPEVVIDAVDLALVENLGDRRVERAGALEIVAEGLFDDHPRPDRFVLVVDEAGRGEMPDDDREELRRHREVEETIPRQVPLALHLLDLRLERLERLELVRVAGVVVERADERVLGRDLLAAVVHRLGQHLAHPLPVGLVAHRRAREADHRIAIGQVTGLLEAVERGDELAFGEISGGAEDHDRDRIPGANELGSHLGRAFAVSGGDGSGEPTATFASGHRRGSSDSKKLTRMRGQEKGTL